MRKLMKWEQELQKLGLPIWAIWLRRDDDGELYGYDRYPFKNKDGRICFGTGPASCINIPNYEVFSHIKSDDIEPTRSSECLQFKNKVEVRKYDLPNLR